jgi:glycosyltransferase involved in cell wall biosynthesis
MNQKSISNMPVLKNNLISIIIPAYNIEKYIGRSIESCLDQTFENLEIIVVNDGSTDKTLFTINEYQKNNSRVTCITKLNGGVNSAIKEGINKSNGSYIIILAGDDYLNKNSLTSLYDNLIKHGSDFSFGGHSIVWDKTGEIIQNINHSEKALNQSQYIEEFLMYGYNSVCMRLFKRELFVDIEFPNIPCGQDKVVSVQIISKVKKVSFCEEIVYNYVVDRIGSTMSGKRSEITFKSFDAQIYCFDFSTNFQSIIAVTSKFQQGLIPYVYRYLYYHPKCSKERLLAFRKRLQLLNKAKITGIQNKIILFLIFKSYCLAHVFVRFSQFVKPSIHKSL